MKEQEQSEVSHQGAEIRPTGSQTVPAIWERASPSSPAGARPAATGQRSSVLGVPADSGKSSLLLVLAARAAVSHAGDLW